MMRMNRKRGAMVVMLGGLALSGLMAGKPAKAGLFDPPPAYPTATPAAETGWPSRPSVPPGYPPTKYFSYSDPAYDWTGFYIGINAGLDWARASWVSDTDFTSGTSSAGSSPFVGGTLGYNAQTIGSFVYGVEFDFDWRDPRTMLIPTASCLLNCELTFPWLATGRVRLGYTFDRVMPYVTVGAALAGERINIVGAPLGVHHDLGVGFVGGGGVEVALWQSFSAKVEYLYGRYNQLTCNTACGVGSVFGTMALTATPSEHIVKFGINYRLWER